MNGCGNHTVYARAYVCETASQLESASGKGQQYLLTNVVAPSITIELRYCKYLMVDGCGNHPTLVCVCMRTYTCV